MAQRDANPEPQRPVNSPARTPNGADESAWEGALERVRRRVEQAIRDLFPPPAEAEPELIPIPVRRR